MKHTPFLTIMSVATAAMVAVGCSHKSDTASSHPVDIDVAEVQVDSVVLYKEYPATLTAISKVDIVARVNGYLRTQSYSAGDHVEKGTVLFAIEPDQYQDAVNKARADLANAKSANEYATQQYAAMNKALQSDAVSQMEVLQAKSNMEQSAAEIRSAEAALQTALTNLGYCTVRAPFSGTVSASGPSVGAYVGGGSSPVTLATIYDNSKLHANFYIEDGSLLRTYMNENNRSMIDYDSIPLTFSEELPHSYAGRLDYMAPDVNTSTGTLKVRATVDNPYNELRDGMYATIYLPYKVDPQAMLIKDSSISTDQLGKYVYLVNDSNKVVYTPIKVGSLVNDTMRVVTEGLRPGARYVTKALLKVRSGMEVTPVLTK